MSVWGVVSEIARYLGYAFLIFWGAMALVLGVMVLVKKCRPKPRTPNKAVTQKVAEVDPGDASDYAANESNDFYPLNVRPKMPRKWVERREHSHLALSLRALDDADAAEALTLRSTLA